MLAPPLLDHSTATYAAAFVMVFFAFTGWEIAAHLSEEFHDPLRDVPRAMLLSFVIAVGFYLGLAFIVGKSGLDGNFESPFAAIFANHYGAAAGRAVAAIAIVLIFANLSAAIWAVSRMVFSAAREGLLPASLAATRDGTPIRAVLAVVGTLLGAIALAAGGILPLQALLEYSGQNFLILYGVAAAVLFFARPDGGTRLVAGLALLAVLGILALRDPGALLYPLALVAISFLVSRALDRPQRNGLARPAEVPPDTAPQEGR